MSVWEILLTLVVFIGALYYLYRRIVVTRGCACGSNACSTNTPAPFPEIGSENKQVAETGSESK